PRGSRGRRRRDDGGGLPGRLPRHGRLRPRMGEPLARRPRIAGPGARRRLRPPLPRLCRGAAGDAARLAAAGRGARGLLMAAHIAIIGDRFMLADAFASAIEAACGPGHRIRTLELPWPDVAMEHGYARPGLDGLKEYLGDPDEVVAFVADAEI